jgi:hypothetical protein
MGSKPQGTNLPNPGVCRRHGEQLCNQPRWCRLPCVLRVPQGTETRPAMEAEGCEARAEERPRFRVRLLRVGHPWAQGPGTGSRRDRSPAWTGSCMARPARCQHPSALAGAPAGDRGSGDSWGVWPPGAPVGWAAAMPSRDVPTLL